MKMRWFVEAKWPDDRGWREWSAASSDEEDRAWRSFHRGQDQYPEAQWRIVRADFTVVAGHRDLGDTAA